MKVTWKFAVAFIIANAIIAVIGAYITYHVNKKLEEAEQVKA